MALIVPELAKRNGVTEKLKAENQMSFKTLIILF